MQCEKCKIKRATVFFTELDRTRHALCATCAAVNKGGAPNEFKDIFTSYTPISYMYELVHNNNRIYYVKDRTESSLLCSVCKTEIKDVLTSGHMGCPKCYGVFGELIQLSDLKKSNYSLFNSKMPKRYAQRKETEKIIESLRQKLQLAIQEENYEYAAKIRDDIKALSIAQKGI